MIALKDNQISVYEGAYRPVKVIKNGEKLAGWKTVGMTGSEGEFVGTYNDALTLYGKTAYRVSRNLCPPPTEKLGNDGVVEWGLTLSEQGRFSLFSKTVGSDVVMLMKPNIINTVTLPSGTYTASSNSAEIRLCFSEYSFTSLPHTFTLDSQQTISFGVYNTDFSETDIYLQIESGESVTDYDPYAGDLTKEPSPDNLRSLASAQGEVATSGKNIYPFLEHYGSTSSPGTAQLLKALPNGFVFQGGYEENSHSVYSWDNGWGVFGGDSDLLYLHAEETVTISADYTVLEVHPSRTGHESIGIWFYGNNMQYASAVRSIPAEVGETTRVVATYTVHVDGYYWPIFTLNSNKVKVENLQIEYGDKATPYQPYLPPQTVAIPELRGIEVTSAAPYNYTETADGVTHYYISDVLQGERLIRNIGVLVLDGTENWSTYSLANDAGFCLYNVIPAVASNAVSCLCNAFSGITRDDMYHGGLGVSVGAAQELRISQCYDAFGRNTEQFKAFLSERYAAGNPVTVYYALAEPQIESVAEYPKTLPLYTKVVATPKVGHPDFGLVNSVKVQES